jgi:hypothetical protein
MTIDPTSEIRKQDSGTLISSVANNKVGRDLAWNWLRGNWPEIHEYFKSGSVSAAGKIIASCASAFNKEFELKELQGFYNEKLSELGIGKTSTESALLKTKANIDWMKKYYKEIVDWLKKKNENPK